MNYALSRGRILAGVVLLSLVIMPLLMIAAPLVRGDFVGTFIVDGTVKDNAGRPIKDVPVVVVSKDGSTVVNTQFATTDTDGFYTVTFPTETVDLGHWIIATATSGGEQVSGNVTVDNDFGLTIDLQFPFEIPQFGTIIGFLAVAAIVGVLAVILLPRKLRPSKQ